MLWNCHQEPQFLKGMREDRDDSRKSAATFTIKRQFSKHRTSRRQNSRWRWHSLALSPLTRVVSILCSCATKTPSIQMRLSSQLSYNIHPVTQASCILVLLCQGKGRDYERRGYAVRLWWSSRINLDEPWTWDRQTAIPTLNEILAHSKPLTGKRNDLLAITLGRRVGLVDCEKWKLLKRAKAARDYLLSKPS